MVARAAIGLVLALLAGCATNQPVEQALCCYASVQADSQVNNGYHVQCPDVLEIVVQSRPDFHSQSTIGPDGCIELSTGRRVRVEGMDPSQAAAQVAAVLGTPVSAVQVRVAGYNSQQIYVFGQVSGPPRAVPYHGPETVRDFLQRAGGITPVADPTRVHVVRSNVADAKRREIFAVDLKAIVMDKDERTDVCLEPFDEVFIGESSLSDYEKALPPLLRPLYDALVNIRSPVPSNMSNWEHDEPQPPVAPPAQTLVRQ